jgi:hypothetical protein
MQSASDEEDNVVDHVRISATNNCKMNTEKEETKTKHDSRDIVQKGREWLQ